jgi:phosphatidylinositol-bisphosphatase
MTFRNNDRLKTKKILHNFKMSEEIEKDFLSLNLRLRQREDDYTVNENIKIFSGTYNLKGKNLDESLLPWFCFHEPCDLYVLGFQELCELSTTSLIINNDWLEREQLLIQNLNQTLCTQKKLNLTFIKLVRLWGIALVIYSTKELAKSINDIITDSVATGILNTLGNKGSVAISLKIHESRFCFLSSHFASDTEQLERRNADYRYTIEKLKLYSESINDLIDFDSHNFTIWLGDFNYRINNLPLDKTLELIYNNDFEQLLKYDQLSGQLEKKRVFIDFQEGKIKFKPTYKYAVKEDTYDIITNSNGQSSISGSGSSKVKLPSWTDRILWKLSYGTNAKLIQYSCINTITISDHKPVYAIFNVDCKRIDLKMQKKIYDSLLKESDRRKNEERPRICLLTQPPEVNFGELTFYQKMFLSIEMKNEGKSIASVDTELHINGPKLTDDQIYFVNNHFGSSPSITSKKLTSLLNEWFKIKRTKIDILNPGQSFIIEITNYFSNTNIARLNSQRHLDDILIIKCLNGNDLFVNICCDYVPSIMGVSLKALSCLDNDKAFKDCEHVLIKHIESEVYKSENLIDKCKF